MLLSVLLAVHCASAAEETGGRDPRRILWLMGFICEDGTVELMPTLVSMGFESKLRRGDYAVVCRDKKGQELRRLAFHARPGRDGRIPLSIGIEFPDTTYTVQLTHKRENLLSLVKSGHPPVIKLIELRKVGDERWVLRTDIADVGGDASYASIRYSADGCETWHILATGSPGDLEELAFDTSRLPGSERGTIAVMASDGLNFPQLLVPMPLPNRPPVVSLAKEPSRDVPPEHKTYRVHTYDPEEGPLPDGNVKWTAVDGRVLGRGHRLVTAEDVAQIKVVAFDSAGKTTVVSLRRLMEGAR